MVDQTRAGRHLLQIRLLSTHVAKERRCDVPCLALIPLLLHEIAVIEHEFRVDEPFVPQPSQVDHRGPERRVFVSRDGSSGFVESPVPILKTVRVERPAKVPGRSLRRIAVGVGLSTTVWVFVGKGSQDVGELVERLRYIAPDVFEPVASDRQRQIGRGLLGDERVSVELAVYRRPRLLIESLTHGRHLRQVLVEGHENSISDPLVGRGARELSRDEIWKISGGDCDVDAVVRTLWNNLKLQIDSHPIIDRRHNPIVTAKFPRGAIGDG